MRVALGTTVPNKKLLRLFACLLAIALPRQRLLHALLFSWLQIIGVAFNFLDDVLLLYLALETAQRIFKGFTLLHFNFRQWNDTPKPSCRNL